MAQDSAEQPWVAPQLAFEVIGDGLRRCDDCGQAIEATPGYLDVDPRVHLDVS